MSAGLVYTLSDTSGLGGGGGVDSISSFVQSRAVCPKQE